MKIGLFAVVAALALGACASARDVPEGEFRIEGRVRHVPDGAILSLVIDKPTGYVVVQADTLRRGKFVFQDTATVLRQLMIAAEGEGFPNTWLPVWVDSGKRIRVNGQDKLLDIWRVEKVRKNFDQREVEIIKGILDDGVREGVFSMPDTDITALVLHYALKGLEVPYIRGVMGDNISQRIKRRDNVMNLIFNGIRIK